MNNNLDKHKVSFLSTRKEEKEFKALTAQARHADLPQALSAMGIKLKKDSTNGWRIPGRGGLTIWLNTKSNRWVWKHHGASNGASSGDSISLLTEMYGNSFKAAVERLLAHPSASFQPMADNGGDDDPQPDQIWQVNVTELVARCQQFLWESDGHEAIKYLRSRGLRDETIKKYCLGWMPSYFPMTREDWGLSAIKKEDGSNKLFIIPEGIVIPCKERDQYLRMKFRKIQENRFQSKYMNLEGSKNKAFAVNKYDGKPIIVVESELDGFFLEQEVGDLVTVIVLGSASEKPDDEMHEKLMAAPLILVSLDADVAGHKASKWWTTSYDHAIYWIAINGKDPGEAFGDNPSLMRKWVLAGVTTQNLKKCG